jgi:NAD(P)-dependent dehydrogenase (short-subunit alcohol dehydrogenase family)
MGILRPHAIEDVSEEEWDRVMAVNLKGTFLCCQAVGREMIKKGGGNIINVASLAGHTPQMNAGAYSPSKAGVISLTKLMAVEWAKHNVRVNVLSPGPIRAPMFDFGFNTEALRRKRAKSVPMNRIGRPEEVANAAVFFASDDSSFVTGHAFVIDGGSLSSVYYLTSLLSS